MRCLSFQGQSSTLANAILAHYAQPLSLMVDRAETLLHDHFGDVHYWRARRSMRYASDLRAIGDLFRCPHFASARYVSKGRSVSPPLTRWTPRS